MRKKITRKKSLLDLTKREYSLLEDDKEKKLTLKKKKKLEEDIKALEKVYEECITQVARMINHEGSLVHNQLNFTNFWSGKPFLSKKRRSEWKTLRSANWKPQKDRHKKEEEKAKEATEATEEKTEEKTGENTATELNPSVSKETENAKEGETRDDPKSPKPSSMSDVETLTKGVKRLKEKKTELETTLGAEYYQKMLAEKQELLMKAICGE